MATRTRKPTPKPKPKPKRQRPHSIYVIRACRPNLTSQEGFKYPRRGLVKAPYFDNHPRCGYGLHAWSRLQDIGNDSTTPSWFDAASIHRYKWLILRVPHTFRRRPNLVRMNDKVKFKHGTVVFCGSYKGALARFKSLTKNDPLLTRRSIWV